MRKEASDSNVSEAELREKLKEYSSFLDSTLHPELQRAVAAREETEADIHEYQELYDKLETLHESSQQSNNINKSSSSSMEAMVNLGHELAYCHAEVENANAVFVDMGMGLFIELSQKEALVAIEKRMTFLQQQKLPRRLENAQKVAAHMESSILILEALARELQQMESSR